MRAPDGSTLMSPQALSRLGGIGNSLGAVGGGLNVYGAATNPYASDVQKAIGATRGGLQAVDAGLKLAGSSGVPYGNYLTTGLDIADVASSNLPDEQKAYHAAAKVGNAALNYFVPVAGGLVGSVLEDVGAQLLFPPSDFMRTRDRESGFLPTDANYSLLRILQASSPAELQAAVSEPTYLGPGRPVQQNGRIGFTGTHLPGLGPLEDALTNAYQRQSGLFSAAQAGDPQALGILGQLQAAGQRRSSDLGTLASVFHNQRIPGMTEYLANPGALRAASTMFPDALRDLIGDWASSEALTAEITGSQAQTHPLIGSILAAGAGLGIDPMESLLAARDRAIQASQPYDTQGEAGVVSGRAFDPRGFDALLGTQTVLPVPMDQGEGGTVWVDPRTGQAVPGLGGGGRFQEQNLP